MSPMFEPKLSYLNDKDREVHLSSMLKWGARRIVVSGSTIAGSPDRPNEDAFAVASNDIRLVAAVFDGTTSIKPIPELLPETGAHFASHFLKDSLLSVLDLKSPEEKVLSLNRLLLEKSRQLGAGLDDSGGLPASTATLVELSPETMELTFAHVADSFCVVYFSDGRSELITNDTTAQFDGGVRALIAEIAIERAITPREARQDPRINKAILSMYQGVNNNPNSQGSGLVNGDPNIKKYIQTGRISMKNVRAILLGSDGLLPVDCSKHDEHSRAKIDEVISTGGFRALFDLKHASEDADPDWQYVRYKHSDDATGIFIELNIDNPAAH